MCGIFGCILKKGTEVDPRSFTGYIKTLYELSESRGKEAAGCAVRSDGSIWIYKQPISASEMIASDAYRKFFEGAAFRTSHNRSVVVTPLTVIGHSRLVTNGSQEMNENNQPVVKDGVVGVHNGIIVNDDKLWSFFPELKKECDVDTEILLSLVRHFYKQTRSLKASVKELFSVVEGSASIALLFDDLPYVMLATNTGSLYTGTSATSQVLVFASELYILKTFIEKNSLERSFGPFTVSQIKPGSALLIHTTTLHTEAVSLKGTQSYGPEEEASEREQCAIVDTSADTKVIVPDILQPREVRWSQFETDTSTAVKQIDVMRRCKKCVLPESFPFIEFDDHGICNYCNSYERIHLQDRSSLEQTLDACRSKSGEIDCIVSLSGGRDSCYGLHYVKKELRMNPIAYSYDWGMITDLGRRNQARLCGKLGVEHLLVSADIKKKRAYIRKNVEAWLKKPDLGIIPLFMAGDKQYFYYANKIMKQYKLRMLVMAENQMERAHFKAGFCGIKHRSTNKPAYFLNISDKIKLALYYGKQYLSNPSYINASLFDTICAYTSYYMIPHNYLYLFNYVRWDEEEIISTLRREYDWELATDTTSTWRIGDGTAAFYNYIYYMVAGFTEIDAFRSNQIREGMITRDAALDLIRDENRPRFASIEWYAQTIGFDLQKALMIINSIPKLYAI